MSEETDRILDKLDREFKEYGGKLDNFGEKIVEGLNSVNSNLIRMVESRAKLNGAKEYSQGDIVKYVLTILAIIGGMAAIINPINMNLKYLGDKIISEVDGVRMASDKTEKNLKESDTETTKRLDEKKRRLRDIESDLKELKATVVLDQELFLLRERTSKLETKINFMTDDRYRGIEALKDKELMNYKIDALEEKEKLRKCPFGGMHEPSKGSP